MSEDAVLRHLGFLAPQDRLANARREHSAAMSALRAHDHGLAIMRALRAQQWLGEPTSSMRRDLARNIEATLTRARAMRDAR